jgi:hypothetical protein
VKVRHAARAITVRYSGGLKVTPNHFGQMVTLGHRRKQWLLQISDCDFSSTRGE